MSKSAEFCIKGKLSFSVVPDALLENTQLSPATRLVAAWLVGRPDGWVIHVNSMCARLGIGKTAWLRIRKELIATGLLAQTRQRIEHGRWKWVASFHVEKVSTMVTVSNHGQPDHITREGLTREVSKVAKVETAKAVTTPLVQKIKKPNDLDELKRLHVGYTLNALGLAWDEEGSYIKFGDNERCRQGPNGHWLWFNQASDGYDNDGAGSVIDLIAHHEGCTHGQAIRRLRNIAKAAREGRNE